MEQKLADYRFGVLAAIINNIHCKKQLQPADFFLSLKAVERARKRKVMKPSEMLSLMRKLFTPKPRES